MTDRELLKRSILFETLSDNDIDFILTKTEEKIYPVNTVLFQKGSMALHFFIVKSGKVILVQTDEDQKKREIAHFSTGDSFSECEFVTSSLHMVEAIASKNCTCLEFPALAHTMESLTLERPQTISRLYLRYLYILSERLRSIHSLISENTPWVKYLQEQVYTDKLTGLYNKMYLDEKIPGLLSPPVTLIIIKPDRFKELNDIFGHKAGDIVMARLGDLYLEEIKKLQKGWAIRLRSNETALLLQKSNKEEALSMANTLSRAIKDISPVIRRATPEKSSGDKVENTYKLSASIAIGLYENKQIDWHRIFSATYQLMKKTWSEGGNEIRMLQPDKDGSQV
ncbi:MAG: GGDEF domain-containing protein [Spirochaetales bacterium]|nr:GGDEF domain-containing protein [Spirochaetales bacterium]